MFAWAKVDGIKADHVVSDDVKDRGSVASCPVVSKTVSALVQNAHRIFTLFPWDIWTLCIMKKGSVRTAMSVRMFVIATRYINAPFAVQRPGRYNHASGRGH